MSTPDTPTKRLPWSVCSSHAIFETDAKRIWPLLADFKTLATLVPEVASCEVDGAGVGLTRTLTFDDGKVVHELLIVNHPELFRLSYSMQDPAPFPWKHYFCTHQLQPLGAGQTHFHYTGYYHPNGATDAEIQSSLRGFYHAVFEGIGRVLGVKFAIQS
ncbi:MAG: SRPBCC family protein [Chthoniobacterales bacterium]